MTGKREPVLKLDLTAAILVLTVVVGPGHAQPRTGLLPTFEVASVKSLGADSGVSRPQFNCPGGRFASVGFPLKYLIEWAYDIRTEFSVPDWAGDPGERFA